MSPRVTRSGNMSQKSKNSDTFATHATKAYESGSSSSNTLRCERGVALCNPIFHKLRKLSSLGEQFIGFCGGHDEGRIIVHCVPLSTTCFEIVGEPPHGVSHSEDKCFERCLMMPLPDNAMAGAGDGHLRRLKSGIVSGGKATIIGERCDRGVLEVSFNDPPQVINLRFACGVGSYATTLLQPLPAHVFYRLRTISGLGRPFRGNDVRWQASFQARLWCRRSD